MCIRDSYTQEQKELFLKRVKELERYDTCDIGKLMDIFLGIYSNPINKMCIRDSLYTVTEKKVDGLTGYFELALTPSCFIYQAHFPCEPITPGAVSYTHLMASRQSIHSPSPRNSTRQSSSPIQEHQAAIFRMMYLPPSPYSE